MSINRFKWFEITFLVYIFLNVIGCGPQKKRSTPLNSQKSRQHKQWIQQAKIAFEQGDWQGLESLIPRLKQTLISFSKIQFYTGVVKGLESPQEGIILLQKVEESTTDSQLMDYASLYRFIFLAHQKECLTATGPLEAIYLPKSKMFSRVSQELLKTALRTCNAQRNQALKTLSPLPSSATPPTSSLSSPHRPSPSHPPSKKDLKPSPSHPSKTRFKRAQILSLKEKAQHTPFLSVVIPQSKTHPLNGVEKDIREIAPLLVHQTEQKGIPLEIQIHTPKGEQELQNLFSNFPQNPPHAIIVYTTSLTLQNQVISASKIQNSPLFIMSPHKPEGLYLPSEPPLYFWSTSPHQWSKALIDLGEQYKGQRAGAIGVTGDSVHTLITDLAQRWIQKDRKWVDQFQLSPKTVQWAQLSQTVKKWKLDTLFLILEPSEISQLMTYLAQEDLWSTSSLTPSSSSATETRQELQVFLWPSAYNPLLIQQSGRYLEGARMPVPLSINHPEYILFKKEINQELRRDTYIHDALFYDFLLLINRAVRAHLFYKKPLSGFLQEGVGPLRFFKHVDFKDHQFFPPLTFIQVQKHTFKEFQP